MQDYAYDDAGAAIVGATVNLYARNTTTPVLATTTTDANGLWAISYATEGRYDIEVVSGTTKRRRKWDIWMFALVVSLSLGAFLVWFAAMIYVAR